MITSNGTITDKVDTGNYDLFDTIAVGDHLETWDGVHGTVAAFSPVYRECADGAARIFEADILIYVSWTRYVERRNKVILRRVRKHSSELRRVYTFTPAA